MTDVPSYADLRRAAEILKRDAVLTPWPDRDGAGVPAELPRRPADARTQLATIERIAPDIKVCGGGDGRPGAWEALVPSRFGETEVIRTGTLGDMITALERVLRRRAAWQREGSRSAVDLLREQWGRLFAIWWEDGCYWCELRGTGGRHPEPTPEALNGYMAALARQLTSQQQAAAELTASSKPVPGFAGGSNGMLTALNVRGPGGNQARPGMTDWSS